MKRERYDENKIYKQANKEALISIGLTILYFLWWYGFAYGYGGKTVDNYTYIMGFPAWFFYSCILGFIIFSFLTWVVVDKFFEDVPLVNDNENNTEIDQ